MYCVENRTLLVNFINMGLTTKVLVIFIVCKVCTASPTFDGDVDAVSDMNTILGAIAKLTSNLKTGKQMGNEALQEIQSDHESFRNDLDLALSQAYNLAFRLQIYEETKGRDISNCVDDFNSDLKQLSSKLTNKAMECNVDAKKDVDTFVKQFNMPNFSYLVDELEAMFRKCVNIFCKQTTGEYGLLRVTEYKLVVEKYSLMAEEQIRQIRTKSTACLLGHYQEALDVGNRTAKEFRRCADSGFLPVIL